MPIPILKGLRRAGAPQAEQPRNSTQPAKIPSPRASNVRSTSGASSTLAPPSSSIPSFQGNAVRSPRISTVTRSPRPTTSRIGVQSPKPPPRISSVIASPKAASRTVVTRENDQKVKTAQIKKTDNLVDNNLNPTASSLTCNASSSNRSSLISNGSSIPPPSSSSSNRNSNSSISSNFSLSSWNSNGGNNGDITEETQIESSFLPGGSDTFPRSSGIRRSFNVPGSLTTSVNMDSRGTGRSSVQRQINLKSKTSRDSYKSRSQTGHLSSSESSIVQAKSSEELSAPNGSDSNLSRMKIGKTSFSSNLRFNSNRNLGKTSSGRNPAVITKNTSNYNGHSYLPATNRSADPNANKTRLVHPTAIKSPSRTVKSKNKNLNSQSKDSEMKEVSLTVRGASAEITDEEDDGYSSVANTDQHDEEEKRLQKLQDENDYDEVEDEEALEEVQPMKPLEGLSRYSYALHPEHQKRLSSEELPFVQNSENEFSVNCEESSNENSDSRVKVFVTPSKRHHTERDSNLEALKFDCVSPRFIKPTVPQDTQSSKLVCSVPISSLNSKPKRKQVSDTKCVNLSNPITVQSQSDSNMSAIDDSIFDISYKKYVKETKPSAAKDAYSWEVRKSFGDSVPVTTSTRRKLGLMANPETTVASPSLPTLSSVSGSDCSSAPSSRPNSLASPGKLNFAKGSYSSSSISNQFYRTGSLRSPKEEPHLNDRKVTYPFGRIVPVDESISQGTSPTSSFCPFVRNSPKYSTVIPRTLKENQSTSYPFVHSLNNFNLDPSNRCQNIREESEKPTNEEFDHLRRELKSANEKIRSLSEQLSSSNKLVSAYEHSLSNMTQRLQQLSKVAEHKETEAMELRRLLERSCMDSSSGSDSRSSTLRSVMNRSSSIESLTSLASNVSFSSAISSSSAISFSSNASTCDKSMKKKNWLRSSFSKAFKRRDKRKRNEILSMSSANRRSPLDLDSLLTQTENEVIRGYCSLPSSPLPQRGSSQKLEDPFSDVESPTDDSNLKIQVFKEEVARLKRALRNKDSALTESRLENLSSAHQVDSLKESVHRLSTELSSLKSQKEIDGNVIAAPKKTDASRIRISYTKSDSLTSEGKNIGLFVRRSDLDQSLKCDEIVECRSYPKEEYIGDVIVQGKTTWEELDILVNDSFEMYLSYLDPKGKLFLDADAILNYQLGEIKRTPMLDIPELLPYGYLVGEVESIKVNLQTPSLNSVDLMSFETLVSKSHLQRFISFLKEQRRVLLTGPEGVGKSFLAHRLADFVIQRLGIEPSLGNIAKFNVDEKTPQDLHVYLSQLSDLCETKNTDLPLVIILESLERVDKLSELFSASLRVPHDQCPFIIGTLRVSARSTNVLQIHPSFRLIPLDPTQDPVSNILPRLCRRYVRSSRTQNLTQLFEWLCRCLSLLNHVLDSSAVETFGPGTFLPLPSSLNEAQMWFLQLWKSLLLPRLQLAAENVSLVSRDVKSWQDLDKCLREELPWEPNADIVLLPRFTSTSAYI